MNAETGGSRVLLEEMMRSWKRLRALNSEYEFCADGDHKIQVREDIGRLYRYLKALASSPNEPPPGESSLDATPSQDTAPWLLTVQPDL